MLFNYSFCWWFFIVVWFYCFCVLVFFLCVFWYSFVFSSLDKMRTALKVIPTQPRCTYVIHYAGNWKLYQSIYHYLSNLAGRTADETVYQCERLLDGTQSALRVNVLEALTEGLRNVGDRHNSTRVALTHNGFERVELATTHDYHDHRLLGTRVHAGRLKLGAAATQAIHDVGRDIGKLVRDDEYHTAPVTAVDHGIDHVAANDH